MCVVRFSALTVAPQKSQRFLIEQDPKWVVVVVVVVATTVDDDEMRLCDKKSSLS